MNISKIDSITLSLLSYISESTHAAGDRLPAERDLAKILGTSRNTVREILISLRSRDILEVRPGSGCYLKIDPDRILTAGNAGSPADFEAVRQQLESRYIIEPGMAELAMARISQENFSLLEKAIVGLSRAVIKRDYSGMTSNDNSFRSVLAESTGNPVLIRIMRQPEMNAELTWKLLSAMPEEALNRVFANYVKTLNAIGEHNSGNVKKHVQEIILTLCRLLDEYASMDFSGILRHKTKEKQP
jgi:GntR family transcriptional repressor for pyruvate dehydrogenase complex